MKKFFLALLIVILFASSSFAYTAGRWGIGANNVVSNILVAEFAGVILMPCASLFYQFTDDISADLGLGLVSISPEGGDTESGSNLFLKLMYNLGKGKGRPHVGLYANSFKGPGSDATYTDIGVIVGGEVAISDNAALLLDATVLEMVGKGGTSSNYTGMVLLFNPMIGFRWYM